VNLSNNNSLLIIDESQSKAKNEKTKKEDKQNKNKMKGVLKKLTGNKKKDKKETKLQFLKRVFVNLHLNTKYLDTKEPDLVHPVFLKEAWESLK